MKEIALELAKIGKNQSRHIAQLEAREARLLSVARAAKANELCKHGWNAIEFCSSCHTEEDRILATALSAIEDLL